VYVLSVKPCSGVVGAVAREIRVHFAGPQQVVEAAMWTTEGWKDYPSFCPKRFGWSKKDRDASVLRDTSKEGDSRIRYIH
jgi:hypothetical protein